MTPARSIMSDTSVQYTIPDKHGPRGSGRHGRLQHASAPATLDTSGQRNSRAVHYKRTSDPHSNKATTNAPENTDKPDSYDSIGNVLNFDPFASRRPTLPRNHPQPRSSGGAAPPIKSSPSGNDFRHQDGIRLSQSRRDSKPHKDMLTDNTQLDGYDVVDNVTSVAAPRKPVPRRQTTGIGPTPADRNLGQPVPPMRPVPRRQTSSNEPTHLVLRI